MFKVNYSAVTESGNFDPLPPASYLVRIEKVQTKDKEGKSLQTQKGKPLIRVRYKVVTGDFEGRLLFDQIVIFDPEDKGAGMTKHFLKVIEQPFDGDIVIDPQNWIGKELTVTVGIQRKEVNGKTFENNNVKTREYPEIPF